MIESAFQTTLQHKDKTGTNTDGENIYAVAVNCLGRLQYKRRLVRDNQGREIVSEGQYYTKAIIEVDDLLVIDGRDIPVIAVSPYLGFNGTEIYREVAF